MIELRLAAAAAILAALLGCGGESGSGGTGGAASGGACDPALSKTDCDACAFELCCAEEAACEPGTACDALFTCAEEAGCLDPEEELFACAAKACPDETTDQAVASYEALAACVRGNCEAACGL